MTFSILARCPHTGRVGLGVGTFSLSVGLYCNGVRGHTGVTITQAFPNQSNNSLALRLLEQGFTAGHVLDQLMANDPDFEYRQIVVVDRVGRASAYTGPHTRPWSGHKIGDGCVASGNALAGPQVLDGILAGFNEDPKAELELRLLRALEGGRDSGGQVGSEGHITERSAALIVYSNAEHADIDLRVDLHEKAVDELRRIFEIYDPYRSFYRDRGRKPREAVPQEVFVKRLKAAGT